VETKFEHHPQKPKNSEVLNAYVILCNTHDASSSFLHLFETTRKSRKAKGMATDEEQDLLRAMLIFATSGLDSMIKQLIREALPLITNKEEGAKEVFKKHIERKLNTSDQINCKLLAKVLVEGDPQKSLIEELVADLTLSSLQSKDELLKIASYFNIPSNELTNDFNLLREIFDVRNQIVHEMDIDFYRSNRSRRTRRRDDMVKYTNEILRVAKVFLEKADRKLGL